MIIKNMIKWLRIHYGKIINSIAFYPALIAIAFLVLSYVVLQFDLSEAGKNIKSQWHFSLKDASTARTIAATIAAGILSLTVFSFSMVMILLNQAASNMSNRVLDQLIGNRFHQLVLGFYIGTIVYALFLLSTIRDIDTGIYVPALSVYLLIGLTIIDVFLFIYFIHYITQSIKYETIIQRIYDQTHQALENYCTLQSPASDFVQDAATYELRAPDSGYFQGFNQKALLQLCEQFDWRIYFQYSVGSFILKGTPILGIQYSVSITKEHIAAVTHSLNFYAGQPFDTNPYNGFRQLTEIALKALSPGINDPGTAILSLHRLVDLLAYRLQHFPNPVLHDDQGTPRIFLKEPDFTSIFENYLLPIWDYGKGDRLLRQELQKLLLQLQACTTNGSNQKIINLLQEEIAQQTARLAIHF